MAILKSATKGAAKEALTEKLIGRLEEAWRKRKETGASKEVIKRILKDILRGAAWGALSGVGHAAN